MLQIVRFQIPHQKIAERALPNGRQPILITPDSINGINLGIMMEQKKPEKCELTFSGDVLRKYFPRSYTPQRMQETIIKLLEAWVKKRQRDQER